MNKFLTNEITVLSQAPFKYPTMDFIQNTWTNAALMQAKTNVINFYGTYSSTTPYVLFGATISTSGFTTSISAGAILYADEVYPVPAHTISSTSSTSVYGYTNSYFDPTADPTTFSDLTIHNCHEVREIRFLRGATPSSYFLPDSVQRIDGIQWELIAPYLDGFFDASTASVPYVGLGESGQVFFKGVIIPNGSVPANSVFATLPSKYFPSTDRFTTMGYYDSAGTPDYSSSVVWVDATGNLIINMSVGTTFKFFMDSVRYIK